MKKTTKSELEGSIKVKDAEITLLKSICDEHRKTIAAKQNELTELERKKADLLSNFRGITQAQIINLRAASWVAEMIRESGTHFIKQSMCEAFKNRLDQAYSDLHILYREIDKGDFQNELPF